MDHKLQAAQNFFPSLFVLFELSRESEKLGQTKSKETIKTSKICMSARRKAPKAFFTAYASFPRVHSLNFMARKDSRMRLRMISFCTLRSPSNLRDRNLSFRANNLASAS